MLLLAALIQAAAATAAPAAPPQAYETIPVIGVDIPLPPPPVTPVEEQKPAVSIRSSVKPDYIVCLEDGKKLKMMRRHLMTAYGMTPDDYRAKWNLPKDYPMVAPNYAEKRRALAKEIGLGTKGRGGGRKRKPKV